MHQSARTDWAKAMQKSAQPRARCVGKEWPRRTPCQASPLAGRAERAIEITDDRVRDSADRRDAEPGPEQQPESELVWQAERRPMIGSATFGARRIPPLWSPDSR